MSKKKNIERICKNCQLYDPARGECAIVVLHEGQRMRLPVLANDPCFFEGDFFDPTTKAMENFVPDLKQVRFWVENEKGEKTDKNGVVKMEYPEGFMGDGVEEMFKMNNDAELMKYLDMLEESKTLKAPFFPR